MSKTEETTITCPACENEAQGREFYSWQKGFYTEHTCSLRPDDLPEAIESLKADIAEARENLRYLYQTHAPYEAREAAEAEVDASEQELQHLWSSL